MSAINYGHHTGLGQILTFNPFSSQQSYLLSIVIMAMNYFHRVLCKHDKFYEQAITFLWNPNIG